MIFDFNIELKDLNGQSVKDQQGKNQTCGRLLASTLAGQSKGDALKLFGWAQKMWNCEKLDLDKSDQKTLNEFVENSEVITILGKAQILDILNPSPSAKK
jgi:hypothetical protein